MKINNFEDLEVWKKSLEITKEIYIISAQDGFSKDFALRDQIRRATISVSSNIVEGFERDNNNEFIRFLKIAKGSAGEVRNQLYLALFVGYIDKEGFKKINEELKSLSKQIGGFIKYLVEKRKEGEFTNR